MATGANDEDVLKDLKVKTNVVKRLRRELEAYRKEEEEENWKLEQLRNSEADTSDIKYQESVVSESSMMVPDTEKRLRDAEDELASLLKSNEENEGVNSSEVYSNAKEALNKGA